MVFDAASRRSVTFGSTLFLVGIGEGGGNISSGVEDAPDVNLDIALDVEHDVGEADEWPAPEVWDAELEGKAERPSAGVPADGVHRSFGGGDEPSGDVGARFGEVVIESCVDVLGGELPKVNGLRHVLRCRVRYGRATC